MLGLEKGIVSLHVCLFLISLQSFQSFCVPLAELPKFMIRPQFSTEELRKAVSGVTEQVEKFDKLQLLKSGGRMDYAKEFVLKKVKG